MADKIVVIKSNMPSATALTTFHQYLFAKFFGQHPSKHTNEDNEKHKKRVGA